MAWVSEADHASVSWRGYFEKMANILNTNNAHKVQFSAGFVDVRVLGCPSHCC